MQGIRGKHVLVTGGSSGIGQAIAIRFAQEGANVAVNYRKGKEEAEQTHALMHDRRAAMRGCNADGKHILVQGDVASEADVVRIVATTIAELGGLDILINNAGIQTPVDSHELSAEQFDRVEDGLLGISDDQQRLCFALALWNGQVRILKERFFGLTGPEGNHGEDGKEYYYYLDSTPTHSWMRALYKYPQAAYPYAALVAENRRRGRGDPEYELIDTGVFAEDRSFDVFVEYAKAAPNSSRAASWASTISASSTGASRCPPAATSSRPTAPPG